MAWKDDDSEKKERIRVAKALDRQEFWKVVYVAAISKLDSSVSVVTVADCALKHFDEKFGGAP